MILKILRRRPQSPLQLTERQIEQLKMLIPDEILYDADGQVIRQSRQTIAEFVERHSNSWTVQKVLRGEL